MLPDYLDTCYFWWFFRICNPCCSWSRFRLKTLLPSRISISQLIFFSVPSNYFDKSSFLLGWKVQSCLYSFSHQGCVPIQNPTQTRISQIRVLNCYSCPAVPICTWLLSQSEIIYEPSKLILMEYNQLYEINWFPFCNNDKRKH